MELKFEQTTKASGAALTVVCVGMGQDSKAIEVLMRDETFRAHYAPGRLVFVMSDTGNEHPETYAYLDSFRASCEQYGFEFHFLPMGDEFHSESWPSLVGYYEGTGRKLRPNGTRPRGLMTKTYRKSCTVNLKIEVIYRWLAKWISDSYDISYKALKGFGSERGKYAICEFGRRYGKIDVIIGIAAKEDARITFDDIDKDWFDNNINRVYPLWELGIDRAKAQQIIREAGDEVPLPSNCMFCPFMNGIELLWLVNHYPAEFDRWVKFEVDKIADAAANGDSKGNPVNGNHGVCGAKKNLPEFLAEAQAKYGHMTDAEVDEYKFSHGHCLMTKY